MRSTRKRNTGVRGINAVARERDTLRMNVMYISVGTVDGYRMTDLGTHETGLV